MAITGIGIIGCGQHAQQKFIPLAAKYLRHRCRLTALADPNADVRAQLTAAHPGAMVSDDPAAVISHPATELVIIAAPPAAHHALATAALDAGKHVLLEKPVTATLAEADDLVARAARARGKIMIGHHMRFGRIEGSMLELFRRGVTGAPHLVNIVHNYTIASRAPISGYLQKRASCGGVLYEYFCHEIDFLRLMLESEIASLYCRLQSRVYEDDTAALTVEMANGVLVNAVYSAATTDHDLIEVYGPLGKLYFDRYRTYHARFEAQAQLKRRSLRPLGAFVDAAYALQLGRYLNYRNVIIAYEHELTYLLDCIAAGRDPRPSPADGRAALAAVLGAYRSAAEGRAVTGAELR